jgi:hypothetical protein
LLTDPHAPMSDVDGLAVRLGPTGRVAVVDGDDCPLWDGPLVLPPGWAGAATESGLNLLDVERDHLADLFTAIGNGAAVAGTADPCLPTIPPNTTGATQRAAPDSSGCQTRPVQFCHTGTGLSSVL